MHHMTVVGRLCSGWGHTDGQCEYRMMRRTSSHAARSGTGQSDIYEPYLNDAVSTNSLNFVSPKKRRGYHTALPASIWTLYQEPAQQRDIQCRHGELTRPAQLKQNIRPPLRNGGFVTH